ncbi:stAR-related lipid transfer protein 7, mitochondrial-like isoform X1 [Contarinia nasturtii]|uniref:stAR-related lipid transfer protein 7, mitochondrial-like isoform X1 n=1 Tax=Contarinia nasturtii TaxID=265458 RepID=UPI0012D4A1C8|nr:stAR-related lipid transfer protein 7, mitochondrial-like isoform X1 [Contarinia nasturtii]
MFPLQHFIRFKMFDQYFAKTIKNRSCQILRLWTDQCEYIIAQRFRQGQQMICLYRRIWDENVLRGIIQQIRKQLERNAKGLMLSGIGLASAFDWDSERINYESVRKNFDELELVERLRLETIHCDICGHRLIIDCKMDNIVYCVCNVNNTCASREAKLATQSHVKPPETYEKHWQPYMERQNMIIWRREEQPGLFAYKVYASYDDISGEDFLRIQTDTEYRKIWDKSAITLDVIDTDPVHRHKSHIIHWEMQWPKLFSNRDYVFNRRFFIDRNRKLIIIVNKSIVHPFSPKMPNIHRVNDYWSCMVIRSTSNSLKTPGLEYVLTYFENPGVVLPQSITSWVAQKQLPEFLHKLYTATLDYALEKRHQEQQQKHQNEKMYKGVDYFRDPGYEYPPEPEICFSKYRRDNGNDDDVDDDDDFDDINGDNNSNKTSDRNGEKGVKFNINAGVEAKSQSESQACNTDDNTDAKSISWWRSLLYFV